VAFFLSFSISTRDLSGYKVLSFLSFAVISLVGFSSSITGSFFLLQTHEVLRSFFCPTLSMQNSVNFRSAGEIVLYLGSKLFKVLNLFNPLCFGEHCAEDCA